MISQILDRLYIGDAEYTQEDLDRLKINYVLNVGGKITGMEDKQIHMSDDGKNPLWMGPTIIGELGRKLSHTYQWRVLVHCRGGISRSVFIILLWLEKMGMSRDEAYEFIKKKHPISQVNLDLLRSV